MEQCVSKWACCPMRRVGVFMDHVMGETGLDVADAAVRRSRTMFFRMLDAARLILDLRERRAASPLDQHGR